MATNAAPVKQSGLTRDNFYDSAWSIGTIAVHRGLMSCLKRKFTWPLGNILCVALKKHVYGLPADIFLGSEQKVCAWGKHTLRVSKEVQFSNKVWFLLSKLQIWKFDFGSVTRTSVRKVWLWLNLKKICFRLYWSYNGRMENHPRSLHESLKTLTHSFIRGLENLAFKD